MIWEFKYLKEVFKGLTKELESLTGEFIGYLILLLFYFDGSLWESIPFLMCLFFSGVLLLVQHLFFIFVILLFWNSGKKSTFKMILTMSHNRPTSGIQCILFAISVGWCNLINGCSSHCELQGKVISFDLNSWRTS